MKNYTITLATAVNSENIDGFMLDLANEDGLSYDHPVFLSRKQVNAILKGQGANHAILTDRDMVKILKNSSLVANIEKKEEGDTYIATEFSPEVIAKQAKAGQELTVKKTGLRIDYTSDRSVALDIDDDYLDNILEVAEIRDAKKEAIKAAVKSAE